MDITAKSSEELSRCLTALIEKNENDPAFAKHDYYILYQYGNQQSWMLVDFDQAPFRLWHYDVMGRSATQPIKDVITQLQGVLEDVSGKEFIERNREFIEFGGRVDVTVNKHSNEEICEKLHQAREAARAQAVTQAKKSSGIQMFGVFKQHDERPKEKLDVGWIRRFLP